MRSNVSTRFLFITLAALVVIACIYFFSTSNGHVGWQNKNAPPLTVEEKAEVLHSLTLTSAENAGLTPSEAAARQRTLENVAHSSNDSLATQQSDADKLKVLRSLHSQ